LIHLACSTHPLNTSKMPTGNDLQVETIVYDPVKAWDPVKGFEWLSSGYTDSAAAATALATGKKSFSHSINWTNTDRPITPTIVQLAKAKGMATGVVTTVQWSHATPAALGGAQIQKRDQYQEIASQLVEKGELDVIMGAGNPDYDDNGKPIDKSKRREYKYVGSEAVWTAIEQARATAGGTYKGFRPVSTRAEFETLLSGPVPGKVLGTAQVAQTLQAVRAVIGRDDPPYDDPLIAGVPSLADMVRGALRVLEANPRGLYLAVEGGAVDWANHRSHAGRMIEEQADFNRAVRAVVDWVEAGSNWSETLLILTADHETGNLWGPNSQTKPFDPIVDRGVGNVPELHYNSTSHTNSLVPLYARGDAAGRLVERAVRTDPVRGPYLDNTDVFQVMAEAVKGAQQPAPATAADQ